MAYAGLLFSFAEMEREIDNLSRLAENFLSPESTAWLIPQWKKELIAFRGQDPGALMRWAIAEKHPVQTSLSKGKFDRKSSLEVFARLSCVWEISLPNEKHTPKKGTLRNNFLLDGLASTRISIWMLEDGAEIEIARWTLDIGDEASPGCHFHSQLPLDGDADKWFPKELPVPRLPTLLITPMDALEFALGEIFQDEWRLQASRTTDAQRGWAACQRKRLSSLLAWYAKCIGSSSSAPWLNLKLGKPSDDILLKV